MVEMKGVSGDPISQGGDEESDRSLLSMQTIRGKKTESGRTWQCITTLE
jgi:hypothetical protein